jgi:hypothetical protein
MRSKGATFCATADLIRFSVAIRLRASRGATRHKCGGLAQRLAMSGLRMTGQSDLRILDQAVLLIIITR